jgi:protocatechuate 3,4-dioxygenase beta subunit
MSIPVLDHLDRRLRRREALVALGGAGLAGVLGAAGQLRGGGTAAAAASCVLTPEVTEGPYWIDTSLTRRNITEGRPGLPLEVVLSVQNAKTCRPIKGADVEIWHCDAGGLYSGYESLSQGGGPRASSAQGGGHQAPTSSTHYLRGHQKSDAQGRAEFLTVFPGWYRGRTPHIHLKVHVGGKVVHTGQVFFNERTTAAVYRQSPYRTHGQPDTKHAADTIFRQAGGSSAVLRLAGRSGSRKGYRGQITLGVATS